MDIPKSLEKYLTKDEVIEKEFKLKNRQRLYASDTRLLIKMRHGIKDIDYKHISSIELKEVRKWKWAVCGFILFALSILILSQISGMIRAEDADRFSTTVQIFLASGLILIVYGLFKRRYLALSVVGLALPVKLKGAQTVLDDIFILVRDKRA